MILFYQLIFIENYNLGIEHIIVMFELLPTNEM